MEKKMNVEDQKIINLENEVFEKLGEALDLMKKRSDMRLQLANEDGMPDELFKDFQTIQTERFKEIRNFLVAEYFVRFHNEIHFDSANTLAVIETQIPCRFDEARRIENLKSFGEEFFAEEIPALLRSEANQAA
jgi:hypothetical protein|tara:strand:- start:33 stop:434 length:402 start_codon:yes stop_codon:yes gene_type:complete